MEVSWRWCFAPVVLKNGKLLLGGPAGSAFLFVLFCHFLTPSKSSLLTTYVCDCDLSILVPYASLYPYQITSNKRNVNCAVLLPLGLILISFSTGGRTSSELFSSSSEDSHHLRRYLLAALHGSQDGCISAVSS